MATFTSFSDLLPDPDNKISDAGHTDNTSGSSGPGFAKVKFRSINETQSSRTISGRGVAASPGSHNWEFDISYNPMTRAEFEPVAAFLESRSGRLKPFYVVLPQYWRPRDDTFYTYFGYNTFTKSVTNNVITTALTSAGQSSTMVTGTATLVGDPKPGDFFTFTDPADINHKKAYKVIRVENNTTYQVGTTQPSTSQRRIHFHPPLARTTSAGSTLNFINPMFRVAQKGDTVEYDLDTDNLYQFSLSLEEIQP